MGYGFMERRAGQYSQVSSVIVLFIRHLITFKLNSTQTEAQTQPKHFQVLCCRRTRTTEQANAKKHDNNCLLCSLYFFFFFFYFFTEEWLHCQKKLKLHVVRGFAFVRSQNQILRWPYLNFDQPEASQELS